MELKVDIPALAGQNVDPAAFQRVWNRVMPGQSAPRSDAIPDTAIPAQPSVSPVTTPDLPSVPVCATESEPERPPVPDCPADSTPEQPSVPDCPTECPDCPDTPTCPDCPQCPDCPETPVCPNCPQCPPCPEAPVCPDCIPCPPCRERSARPGCIPCVPCPETPALCLGEASQGDSQRLEALMSLAKAGAAAGRALSRRAGGSCAKTLAALAADHRMAFRRLSAAYFLITGTRYTPTCTVSSLPASLALALRQQFVWEQQWDQQNTQAAQATSDPCLKELYLELAQEGALHAGCIRSLLEQMT